MESKEKELFLEMIRVEEDLKGMNSELYNLIEKYPENMSLIELKKQNKVFLESDILKKISSDTGFSIYHNLTICNNTNMALQYHKFVGLILVKNYS